MSKNDNTGKGFVLGVATAAAAFAGYYLFGPKGSEHRTKVRGWTLKAKGEVLEKIEKLKEISEDDYHKIVDGVMAKYKKVKSTTKAETDKLEKELKSRFKNVKRDLNKTKKTVTKKATKEVKKARIKIAKKIAPKKTVKKKIK